jgi:hypothetical protein
MLWITTLLLAALSLQNNGGSEPIFAKTRHFQSSTNGGSEPIFSRAGRNQVRTNGGSEPIFARR